MRDMIRYFIIRNLRIFVVRSELKANIIYYICGVIFLLTFCNLTYLYDFFKSNRLSEKLFSLFETFRYISAFFYSVGSGFPIFSLTQVFYSLNISYLSRELQFTHYLKS